MSEQPAFTSGSNSSDAMAVALAGIARWGDNKRLQKAVTLVLESYVELLEAAQPAPGMHLIGWLAKWSDWEQTHLVGRDEDPRARAWDDDPPTEIVDLYANVTVPLSSTPSPPKVPGRVTLRIEWEGVWEGSSFTNLRDLGDKWLCDWPTPSGTISNLEVPKNLCTEPTETHS
ncbi:hypothetical protein J7E49_06695 [Variovorax paradoxus]|nr:hypothetical protein [Variovorax paradoxus]